MLTKNFADKVNNRRVRALNRLQAQLTIKMKQPKGTYLTLDMVPLTDSDIKRIKSQIETLESRVVSKNLASLRRTKKYRGGQGYTSRN